MFFYFNRADHHVKAEPCTETT